MRCQRQILDVCWWVHVSDTEVFQRSGLSIIVDILRHRRLSMFSYGPGVPARDALRLMVDTYEGRKAMVSWRRPPGRPRNIWLNNIQEDTKTLHCYTLWRSEIAIGHGAAQQSLGLRDDDDGNDDDEG